jgi:biopolymer transport protein TolR
MGMSVGNNTSNISAEPNVVPMIDIMLVLLIIFMVMQPMMRKAIDLQLPDPNPNPVAQQTQSDQIVMEILPGEKYLVNKADIAKADLPEYLKGVYGPRPEKIMFIKGDPTVRYQDVIWGMDVARGAGVKVIGVTPPDPK